MFILALLAPLALADDGGLLGDIDLGDIDLSSSSSNGLTYTGGLSQESGETLVNAKVNITANGAGSVVVRCTDYTSVRARVDYSVDGTSEGPMKSYGDGIHMSTTGSGASASVSLSVPTKPSGVKASTVTLTVSVPKEAILTISGTGGRVDASGCDGSVTVTAGKGASVEGHLDAFSVTATDDAAVVVSGDNKITGTSKIASKSGSVSLVMAMSQDLKLDARAPVVNVEHLVQGTVTGNVVSGPIGAGGPALTITAAKEIAVRTR